MVADVGFSSVATFGVNISLSAVKTNAVPATVMQISATLKTGKLINLSQNISVTCW